MAWLALTNPNAVTASSRSPEQTRPRFCQYLALSAQHPVLPPQPREFLALARGQAVAAQPFIKRCLLDPFADRIGRGFELARQLVDAAPGARQLDDPAPVFRRIWWMGSWHWGLLLPFSPT